MAWLIAHEIGHLAVADPYADPNDFQRRARDELQADCFGARLTVKAGFKITYPWFLAKNADRIHAGRSVRWEKIQHCAAAFNAGAHKAGLSKND